MRNVRHKNEKVHVGKLEWQHKEVCFPPQKIAAPFVFFSWCYSVEAGDGELERLSNPVSIDPEI